MSVECEEFDSQNLNSLEYVPNSSTEGRTSAHFSIIKTSINATEAYSSPWPDFHRQVCYTCAFVRMQHPHTDNES